MKSSLMLHVIFAFVIAGCDTGDVEPVAESLFESCLVYKDDEFQDIPLDTEPIYIHGGEDSLNIHIVMQINYPASARENDIQGLTFTSFEINESGILENIQDAGSEYEILSDATLAALSSFEGQVIFEPAILDGNPVRVQKTIMVRYKLE